MPARPAAVEELGAQARLAGARLGHDAHHLAAAAARALERGVERRPCHGRARRSVESPRARERSRRVRNEPTPSRSKSPTGSATPLTLRAAEILEREVALDEPGRVLRDADVSRLGERLHALREADGVPLRGVVHAQVVADPADHDLARVEPDADRERHPVLRPHLVRVGARGVAQVERRVAGPLRVVLVRDRRAEERHDAVAGELVDVPSKRCDAVGEDREEAIA